MENMVSSKGITLETMQNLYKADPFPVVNNHNHTVMYELPICVSPPKPRVGEMHWDKNHVKMPFSSQSLYAAMEDGIASLKPRWELIQIALSKPIKNTEELQEAILIYNPKYKNKWKFTALHILFNEELEEEETHYFFANTLPAIIKLALQLPILIRTGLPHLRQNKNHSVSLSQQQISSLLANAFLCTFPHRNTQKTQSEYYLFPDINFSRLYECGSLASGHVLQKLNCICHYFRRVCIKVPQHVVTFTRQHIPSAGLPNWDESTQKLGDMKIHITSEGTIEDDGLNMLQVDFANKWWVLGWGCVQEEIRFVICPELIVSRLFTEALKPNEALIITGCERYNKYTGYSQTFLWAGSYVDETPCDSSSRRKTTLVAIDALQFSSTKDQFTQKHMERELNKAYVGFRSPFGKTKGNLQPVATGNWGCGAFKGDAALKALLQMMAARFVERDLVYFTFGDDELCEKIYNMWCFLRDNNITIGRLWKYLREFHVSNTPVNKFYQFLIQQHMDSKQTKTVNYASSKSAKTTTQDKLLPGYNPFNVANRSQIKNFSKPSTSKSPTKKRSRLSEDEIEQCFQDDFEERLDGCAFRMLEEVPAKVESMQHSLLDSLSALEGEVRTDQPMEIPESEHSDSDEEAIGVDGSPSISVSYVNETSSGSNKSELVNNNGSPRHSKTAPQLAQRKMSDFFTSFNKK